MEPAHVHEELVAAREGPLAHPREPDVRARRATLAVSVANGPVPGSAAPSVPDAGSLLTGDEIVAATVPDRHMRATSPGASAADMGRSAAAVRRLRMLVKAFGPLVGRAYSFSGLGPPGGLPCVIPDPTDWSTR